MLCMLCNCSTGSGATAYQIVVEKASSTPITREKQAEALMEVALIVCRRCADEEIEHLDQKQRAMA